MIIRASAHCPYPGGRWYLWGWCGDYTLATTVSSADEWRIILDRYRRSFPTINARKIA